MSKYCSKFIQSPSFVLTKESSKFESRSNFDNGSGDHESFDYFYNSMDEKKERKCEPKLIQSKTSVVSTSRKPGRYFEKAKQRIIVEKRNRERQKKFKENLIHQEIQAKIDELVNSLNSKIESKRKPKEIEKPQNQRKTLQIFWFLAALIIYSISLFYFIDSNSFPLTARERKTFSLFSTQAQTRDSIQFNFFSKFLRK